MPILSAFGAAKAIGVAGRPSVQNYSYDFNSGVVTYPTNAAFAVGSNDFSIECFVYLDAAPAISAPVLDFGFSTTLGTSFWYRCQFYIDSNRRLVFVRNLNTSIQTISGTNPQISLSTWTYIACSRVSGTVKLFVGTTEVASTLAGGTVQTSAAPPTIGNGSVQTTRYIDGKISNLRFNVGSGFSSATIPTQPLVAVATTKILTCQSSTIKDNSVANSGGPWSVTSSGVTVSTSGPF
jgi:Concanavalin A-like lectin/glucanases superfamily